MTRVTKRKAKTRRRESIQDAASRFERDALRRRVQRQRQIRHLMRTLGAEILRTRTALQGLWIDLNAAYGPENEPRHIHEQQPEPAELVTE
jgi:hypothetical protein